jgi:hypothetical protein
VIQVVAKRKKGRIRSVECFEEAAHLDAAVCAELGEIERMEVEVFLGSDLLEVVESHRSFFGESA